MKKEGTPRSVVGLDFSKRSPLTAWKVIPYGKKSLSDGRCQAGAAGERPEVAGGKSGAGRLGFSLGG